MKFEDVNVEQEINKLKEEKRPIENSNAEKRSI